MEHTASVWDIAGAVAMTALAVAMWAAVAVLAYATRSRVRPWCLRASVGVVAAGVLGQIGHLQEHVAQAGSWVLNPERPPWMTPWGDALARGFGIVDPATHSLGMEILHLVGNSVFLAGLAGIVLVTRYAAGSRARWWARMGVWMQGLHGLEHLVLTVSVAIGQQAVGLSTWFGTLPAGPALWTYRVWWHFVANVVGSVIFAIALHHAWRERRLVTASWSAATPGPRVEPDPADRATSSVHLKAARTG